MTNVRADAFDTALLREMVSEARAIYGDQALEGMYAIKTSTGQYEAFLPKSNYFPRGKYWYGQANSIAHAKSELLKSVIGGDEAVGTTKTSTRDPRIWAQVLSKLYGISTNASNSSKPEKPTKNI